MKKYNIFLNLVYFYLVLPMILFISFWTKLYIAIPGAILLIFAYILVVKSTKQNISKKENIIFDFFSKKTIFLTFLVAFVWCYFAGQGGFFYQSSDHPLRNIVFADLIFYKWPVVYEKYDTLLCYYVGHWLVPSVFGKISMFLFHNKNIAWVIARIALLFWSTFGITICFLLLGRLFYKGNKKNFWSAVLLFIIFSGLDIIGVLINHSPILEFYYIHLEWWNSSYQYSSFTTCLFWVYNQVIPAWIATLLLLSDDRIENFMFAGLSILVSSPFPLVGLVPVYVTIAIKKLNKTNYDLKFFFKKVFSIQNVIALIVIVPCVSFYLASNSAVQAGLSRIFEKPEVSLVTTGLLSAETVQEDESQVYISKEKEIEENKEEKSFVLEENTIQAVENSTTAENKVITLLKIIKRKFVVAKKLLLYFFLEFLIYFILCFKNNKRNPLFWVLLVELLVIPFIHVGGAGDFCMRASGPPLVVLMTLVLEDFLNEKNKKIKFALYIMVFSFAMITPAYEFFRGYVLLTQKNPGFLSNEIHTMDNPSLENKYNSNVHAYDYSKSAYYKYFGK